jgi:hypothetical protein
VTSSNSISSTASVSITRSATISSSVSITNSPTASITKTITSTPSISGTKSLTPSPTPIYEQIVMYNQSIINVYQSTSSESFNVSLGIALGAFLCFLFSFGCYIFWTCFYCKKRKEVLCENCKGNFRKDRFELHKRVCKIKTYVESEAEVTIIDKIYGNL